MLFHGTSSEQAALVDLTSQALGLMRKGRSHARRGLGPCHGIVTEFTRLNEPLLSVPWRRSIRGWRTIVSSDAQVVLLVNAATTINLPAEHLPLSQTTAIPQSDVHLHLCSNAAQRLQSLSSHRWV